MKKYLIVLGDGITDLEENVVFSTNNEEIAQAWVDGFNAAHEHTNKDKFADVIEIE